MPPPNLCSPSLNLQIESSIFTVLRDTSLTYDRNGFSHNSVTMLLPPLYTDLPHLTSSKPIISILSLVLLQLDVVLNETRIKYISMAYLGMKSDKVRFKHQLAAF